MNDVSSARRTSFTLRRARPHARGPRRRLLPHKDDVRLRLASVVGTDARTHRIIYRRLAQGNALR